MRSLSLTQEKRMTPVRFGDTAHRFIQDPITGTAFGPQSARRACKTLFSTSAGRGATPQPLR